MIFNHAAGWMQHFFGDLSTAAEFSFYARTMPPRLWRPVVREALWLGELWGYVAEARMHPDYPEHGWEHLFSTAFESAYDLVYLLWIGAEL